MEVPDHHGVESVAKPGDGDLAKQAFAVERTLIARSTRPARALMRERNSEIRMQPPVQREAHRMADHALEDLVAQIAPDETVSVMQPDAMAFQLELERPFRGRE